MPEAAEPTPRPAPETPRPPGVGSPGSRPRRSDPTGKRALFSTAPGPGGPQPPPPTVEELQQLADDVARQPARPSMAGFLGSVTVECRRCATTSVIDPVRSLRLHLPLVVIRPGRGHTHLMTCPACRRRGWLSVSWKPFAR